MTNQVVRMHRVIRVQGSDEDLTLVLDNAEGEGYELVQVIPTGGVATTNPAAEGSWLVIVRSKKQ